MTNEESSPTPTSVAATASPAGTLSRVNLKERQSARQRARQRNRLRARLRAKLKVLVGTGKNILAYLACLFILAAYIAIMMRVKAGRTGCHEDMLKFYDYLSYVMPCLAGVIAGYAVFSEPFAKPLFTFSCLSLALGLGFYLAAHEIKGPAFAGLLTIFLLVPWMALFRQAWIYRWTDRTAQGLVWAGVALLLGCIVLVLTAVFQDGLS